MKKEYLIVIPETGKTWTPKTGTWTRSQALSVLSNLKKNKPWKFGTAVVRQTNLITTKSIK